ESIRDKTETAESLREALNPLLENWWRQTVLDKRNCPDCFTDSYAEIRERPVSGEKSDNTTLPETSPPLPDYLIVPAADDVLAIIRNPADRVYTLRILQTAAGWRIDDELLL
ncbi:MAG: hypothetical protein KDJ38_10330, partial [Gammaproteobacteria bacterium]|nr:hypothetical protein [Gammaproteobacteria bacterium]